MKGEIQLNEVNIHKMILHVLDNSVGIPVLSEKEHPYNMDIIAFITTHIEKAFNDINAKKASFGIGDSLVKNIVLAVSENKDIFVEKTIEFANFMFNIMVENTTIPPCDLICTLFTMDDEMYLGFFIFNYKSSYIHYVDESTEGRVNTIIKQKTALPGDNQKADEFIIISLQDYSILLKEKKYEINGEKEFYISKLMLNSEPELSDKEKVDIVNKVSKKIVKDYYEDDISKIAEIKNAIVESIEDTNSIDINYVKTKVFQNNIDLQNIYDEEIVKRGLTEKVIEVSENLEKKVPKTQKLVTDNGIEIKIPVSYLTTSENVEFINNPDGTISILLKNIKELQGK